MVCILKESERICQLLSNLVKIQRQLKNIKTGEARKIHTGYNQNQTICQKPHYQKHKLCLSWLLQDMRIKLWYIMLENMLPTIYVKSHMVHQKHHDQNHHNGNHEKIQNDAANNNLNKHEHKNECTYLYTLKHKLN